MPEQLLLPVHYSSNIPAGEVPAAGAADTERAVADTGPAEVRTAGAVSEPEVSVLLPWPETRIRVQPLRLLPLQLLLRVLRMLLQLCRPLLLCSLLPVLQLFLPVQLPLQPVKLLLLPVFLHSRLHL